MYFKKYLYSRDGIAFNRSMRVLNRIQDSEFVNDGIGFGVKRIELKHWRNLRDQI